MSIWLGYLSPCFSGNGVDGTRCSPVKGQNHMIIYSIPFDHDFNDPPELHRQ
jgi:hypothetical protein